MEVLNQGVWRKVQRMTNTQVKLFTSLSTLRLDQESECDDDKRAVCSFTTDSHALFGIMLHIKLIINQSVYFQNKKFKVLPGLRI